MSKKSALLPIGFEWDQNNRNKNWVKHQVSTSECEQVFFNQPHQIASDSQHSRNENRFSILGITNQGRKLLIIFILRNDNIRVISARDQSKKEREKYHEIKKQYTILDN